MNTTDPLSRRQFIGQASCAGVRGTALLSTLLTLRLANSLAAQTAPSDYKALVCLFLAGGNDSFNMLTPLTGGEYDAYARVRGNLALARNSLLQIAPTNLGGRLLGVHPSMPEIRDLFNEGRLAFVSNVGSLVRPTTLADYRANRYRPVSLYSHADQIKQWQTCMPDQRTAIGWGGRAADIIKSLNTPGMVSMNISLSGQSTFLTGENSFNYSIGANGATALAGYNTAARNNLTALRTSAADSLLESEYRSLLAQTYGSSTRNALNAYAQFSEALNGISISTAVPSGNNLASNLAMIARVASANGRLGARRQIFFVQLGGWDHHDEVLNNQVNMLATVSRAVRFFWDALGEAGLRNNVTLFTASDFGRTLTSNGNGSDHAWGGNHFVMGGSVRGGRVAGNADQGYYPDFQRLADIDTGQGRLIPGVAVDEYARDLLTWFGISAGDLDYVLPSFGSRFGGRPSLELIGSATSPTTPGGGTTTPPPPTTPTGGGGGGATSSGGGSGGGSFGVLSAAAIGGAIALRALAKRKAAQAVAAKPAP